MSMTFILITYVPGVLSLDKTYVKIYLKNTTEFYTEKMTSNTAINYIGKVALFRLTTKTIAFFL